MGNADSGRDRSGRPFLDYYLVVLLICAPLCVFLVWQSFARPQSSAMDQAISWQPLMRNLDQSLLIGHEHRPSQQAHTLETLSGPSWDDGSSAQQSSAQQLELHSLPSSSGRIRF